MESIVARIRRLRAGFGVLTVSEAVWRVSMRPTSRLLTMTLSGRESARTLMIVRPPSAEARGVRAVRPPASAAICSMRALPSESHRTHAQKRAESGSVTTMVSRSVTRTVSVSVRVLSECRVSVVELLQLAPDRAASSVRAVKDFLKDFGEVADGGP